MTGKGGHEEVGQHFSGTSTLVLVPGDKHSTAQSKHRDETEKWAWTVGGTQDPLSPPTHFKKDLKEGTVPKN